MFERDALRTEGLHGYRVGIDPDGSRALHALLPPDLYDTFVATCARAPRWFNMITEQLQGGARARDPGSRRSGREREVGQPDDPTPGADDRPGERDHLRQGVHQLRAACRRHSHRTLRRRLECHRRSAGRCRWRWLSRPEAIPPAGPAWKTPGIIAIAGKLPITDESAALLPPRVFQGISMVQAPKGYFCILHVMEFKWDRSGKIKNGIGGSDAELIKVWPGLQFDNTRDYINWGFSATRGQVPGRCHGATRR